MAIVIIEAVAPVASWRPPEALTYQRSLPLPPYTSLVGTLGAALGLALPDVYRFVSDQEIRLGVGGWHEGQGRDLWKYQKLESIDEAKPIKTDVLLREFWTDIHLALVFETPDRPTANLVADAFRQPSFPLTAGPSDSLMKAVAIRVEEAKLVASRRLAFSMVFGELPARYKLAQSWDEIPLSQVIRSPTVERLPTGFHFAPDSPRRLSGRGPVTFIADPIDLDDEVDAVIGYAIDPQSRALQKSPVYPTLKKALPWIIPVHRYDSPSVPSATSSTAPSPSGKTPRRGKPVNPIGNT